jgi:hypothetical protein
VVLHFFPPLCSAQLPTPQLELLKPQVYKVYIGDAWIYPALFERCGAACGELLVGELATVQLLVARPSSRFRRPLRVLPDAPRGEILFEFS